jgi:hypothetical protein
MSRNAVNDQVSLGDGLFDCVFEIGKHFVQHSEDLFDTLGILAGAWWRRMFDKVRGQVVVRFGHITCI